MPGSGQMPQSGYQGAPYDGQNMPPNGQYSAPVGAPYAQQNGYYGYPTGAPNVDPGGYHASQASAQNMPPNGQYGAPAGFQSQPQGGYYGAPGGAPNAASGGYYGAPAGAPNMPPNGQAYQAPGPAPYQAPGASVSSTEKNKVVAGLLALFLGCWGIHKFYLGYPQAGLIMLLITIIGAIVLIGPLITAVIALVEGITYLTRTDQQFYQTYVVGDKPWF